MLNTTVICFLTYRQYTHVTSIVIGTNVIARNTLTIKTTTLHDHVRHYRLTNTSLSIDYEYRNSLFNMPHARTYYVMLYTHQRTLLIAGAHVDWKKGLPCAHRITNYTHIHTHTHIFMYIVSMHVCTWSIYIYSVGVGIHLCRRLYV